jgi:hypothetical protein
MELGAKVITKFTYAIRNWGVYVLQKFVIEAVFECLCRAKMHHANGFLEKKWGKNVLQMLNFGGLIRKAQVKKLDFAIAL